MKSFRDSLSAHSIENTLRTVRECRGKANSDWERDFLHDLNHDLNNGKSISAAQRTRLDKIASRPVKQDEGTVGTRQEMYDQGTCPCPETMWFKSDCEWSGPDSELLAHYREHHPELIPEYLQ